MVTVYRQSPVSLIQRYQRSLEELQSRASYYADMEFVLDFYNEMHRKYFDCQPNTTQHNPHITNHTRETYTVNIIVQNIDNLHDEARSTYVLYLYEESA